MSSWLENPALRLISLGIAVLLWYVIAGERTSEMGLSVPVELQNFPQDLELTGDPVNAVDVRLRASSGIIQRLGPGDVSARIDLGGAAEGERIVHLTSESIRVPFGVKVVKISPAILTLNFERTVEKSVPIRPRLLGHPAAGHEVALIGAEPREVEIVGPQGRIQDVDSAFTEPVSVEGATSGIVKDVAIGLEDPVLRIRGGTRVRVTVQIRETQKTRAFEGVEVGVRGGRAAVSPARVTVRVTGPVSLLDKMTPADVKPFVEVARARTNDKVPVEVELAAEHAGVTVKEADPAQVVVRLRSSGK